ncbi:hypothetical protein SK128_028321 [Halocaridina rubra]|uniref:Ionotropic glutamate receptor C-terminal domain-containing protein n=1 Tax=Halocaridina rubra TaxID=373956 RepID=A0AAN8X4T5_HALRR
MKTEYVYSSWHVVIIFNLCMKTLISATFIGSTNLPTRNVFSKQENRNAAVLSVLDKTPCSYILLRRNTTSYDDLTKDLCESKNCQGIAVFEFPPNNDRNATKLNQLLRVIRQIRIRSECAVLIVLNDDPKFLMTLADVSLTQRTLGGSTRFLVVGQLQYQDISYLTTHWIFAMMNTVFIVPSMNLESASWYLYTYLPYSSSENLLAKIGKWTQKKGLILSGGSSVFQEKFTDFHGATVNFTALPYKPYWTDDNLPDGDRVYSGADRQMLEAMASALNFSIYILPVQSWDEVLQRVAERVSFMSPVVHMVLPQRLLRVDFTCTYEHGINIAFAMAKPVLKPQWQSLYYPLSDQVWLYALGVLIITILSFLSVQNGSNLFGEDKSSGIGALVLSVLGSLFGQTFSTRCPTVSSMRVLIAFWLIFVFILGSAYKGNLIAFLVAPRYPPRPETLAELVKVAERVTMPSYGEQFRNFLKSSEFPNFQALGNMLQVGVSVTDGLQLALKYR